MTHEIVPIVPRSSRGVGNTKQSTPLKHWFLTYNNYTEEDISSIVPWFTNRCTAYSVQEEIGASGTKHLQGVFTFDSKIRFETLTKLYPKAHWEPCKSKAANNYCRKDTFEGARRWTKGQKEDLDIFRPVHPAFDFIEQLYTTKPDNRTIHWYWEETGGIGKSAFSKYMYVKYGVTVITSTKSADIVTAIQPDVKMVIFDWPRCTEVGTFCPFNAIEQIKNGFITDSKLKKEARILAFNSPHVIIFANEPPNLHKLSKDRWHVSHMS